MKKEASKVARGTLLVIGTSFKKTLSILIPPEILKDSSFFGGLNRLGDAINAFGSESKSDQVKGVDYTIRHSGGAIADLALGVALIGVPITLVTAMFSDGCKVVSHIIKGSKIDDPAAAHLGDFFGDISVVSNNFMKLFDIPSKKAAEDVRGSIETTIERLDREGMLTEKMRGELTELEAMCEYDVQNTEKWFEDVQRKLCSIAESGFTESRVEMGAKEIHSFIVEPTVGNMARMRDSIVHDLELRGVSVKETSMDFVNKLIENLENLSKEDFQKKMTDLMIKQYETIDKAQDAVDSATYHGYALMHSLFRLTYKGASLFGHHYKKQIKCAVQPALKKGPEC